VRQKGSRMETRDIAAVLIGLEVGLAIGLIAFGTTLLAPMWMGLLGAAVGFAVRRGRLQLIRRALRNQLRAAR
jgi:type II secretory pathway pseudopilin PulG